MMKTYRFIEPTGTARCVLRSGRSLTVPIVPGIFKHALPEHLQELLADEDVLRKYTKEALRKGPWQILREFPRWWLRACLEDAELPASRRQALRFMLGMDVIAAG